MNHLIRKREIILTIGRPKPFLNLTKTHPKQYVIVEAWKFMLNGQSVEFQLALQNSSRELE